MNSKRTTNLSTFILFLGVCLVASTPSKADGIVDFNVGNTNICVGMLSCLFKPKTIGDRNADNEKDHRENTTDHRAERTNTVVPVKDRVRDHRSTVVVRDHRTSDADQGVRVRDHRVPVRDHR